jgi:hypothetical protein
LLLLLGVLVGVRLLWVILALLLSLLFLSSQPAGTW